MDGFSGRSAPIVRTQLPVTRVKRICKVDPNCSLISAEAVQLLTLATEQFIGLLAKAAYGQATFDKRKTLQFKDLEFCIKNYELFQFLNDALDGWPERNGGRQRDGLSDAVISKMSSEMPDAEVDEDETEDLNLDTDGLCNEVYGFDDSLLGTVPVVSPFVAESGKAADENSQDVRMEEDSVPESSAVKPDLFGHYGYSFAANPSSAENAQESVDDVQMDEGFEVETRDASTASSLLNGTGVELASEAFESMPETQPPTIPTHQGVFEPPTRSFFAYSN